MTRGFRTALTPKARQAEEARLGRLCKSINKNRAALDFAVEESFERLRAALPELIAGVTTWLKSYGIAFGAEL